MKVGLSSTDMLDWNDEETSSIIWDGDEESGDHIVPYPEGDEEARHQNSQNQESSAIKLAENKLSGGKPDFHATRPENSSASSRNGGVSPSGIDSWPDMVSSNVTRMDLALLDDEVFDDSALINMYLSKEIGPRDEEITNFVEYEWENISSFDDLDRIFSNHEPMFASVTLGNSDKIWLACKYTTDSPPKSFSINTNYPFMCSEMFSKTSDMRVKSKFGKQDRQYPDLSFEKMDDSVSLTLPLKDEISDVAEGGGGESESLVVEAKGHSTSSAIVAENTLNLNEFVDKVYGLQALPKVQKRFKEKTKGKSLPSVHAEGLEAFSYNHISNSYITPPFSNYAISAEEVPRTSNYESGEFKCQAVLPGYEITSSEIYSAGKPLSSYGKLPPMAPRENNVKLRKRRQMQAMLAIQRQLQQLGDPVSHDFSARSRALESPNHLPAGSNDQFDNLNALPSIDLSSSNEQGESSVLSAAENGYSAEETVLHRLHEVVSKLDSAIRISIRDSMFRLAKSAVQRQQTTDVSTSPNGGEQPEVAVEEESDANREVKVTDVETDTNPRDRAVAHLFFHIPMENSPIIPRSRSHQYLPNLIWVDNRRGEHNLEKSESGKSYQTKLNFSTRDLGSPCQQNVDWHGHLGE